jgi:hypothetical protein
MANHVVLGVHITDRVKQVAKVQGLLSEYGCLIRTRLGLHETSQKTCSPTGLLLLELVDDAKIDELSTKLSGVEGVEVQRMVFRH